ncbi:porin [Caballeronia sp. dw_19]|jgi:predicted porin|uniref:porin n=1 Tax=Caballeronia sp. dw_19 TaxID=2719791 RepID=UPI001BD233DA|nr:porin [Caballeronia sp. dw_19]
MKVKKSLLAMCAVSAITSAAHAQSSVTLYGLIDEGLDYTSNAGGHSLYALSSGDEVGSRWGLKGTEDLGGGVRAIFDLESGFNVDNGKFGQEGQAFGRQAFVGLSSSKLGELTFGRQYDSLVDFLSPLTVNGSWGSTLFAHPYDNDNTNNTFRLNNAIKYTSLDYRGFSFGGAYAFSNSTGFAMNRAESIGAHYTNGPLSVAAAYLNVDNPNDGTNGAVAIGPNGNPDGSWTANRQRIYGVGINYTIAPVTLGFVFTNTDLSQPTATQYATLSPSPTIGAASSIKFNNFEFNAKYQLTPSLFVGGMYTYTQATYDGTSGNSAKAKYHQAGLMADLNISKRTDVYIQGAYLKLISGSNLAGTGLDVAANPDTASPSSGDKQFVARVGMRHSF